MDKLRKIIACWDSSLAFSSLLSTVFFLLCIVQAVLSVQSDESALILSESCTIKSHLKVSILYNFMALSQADTGGVLLKKVFLKFRKMHRKTPVSDSLFKESRRLETCIFTKKRDSGTGVFNFEFCEIFKSIFFTEYLRTTASVLYI